MIASGSSAGTVGSLLTMLALMSLGRWEALSRQPYPELPFGTMTATPARAASQPLHSQVNFAGSSLWILFPRDKKEKELGVCYRGHEDTDPGRLLSVLGGCGHRPTVD